MSMADDIRDLLERKKAATYALLENWAGELESYAKQNAPWHDRTSHARQGLNAGVERDNDTFTLYLSHGIEYGRYLEEGTPPHIIRPVNKKALYWKGAPHPVKVVHNPGMKARAIIGPTFDANIKRIGDSLDELWSDK